MPGFVVSAGPVCFLWLILLIFLLRRRHEALPALVLAGIYIVMALWGGALWNWSRAHNGAGLPASYTADTRFLTPGNQAFLVGALGVLCGGLAACLTRARQRVEHARDETMGTLESIIMAVAWVALALWLLGQGPNIVERSLYMQTNGNQTILHATSLFAPILGAAALGLSGGWHRPPRRRLPAQLLGVIWFVLLNSVGSRVAVIFPVLILVHTVVWAVRTRSIISLLCASAGAYFFAFLAVRSFVVTQMVRSQAHGIRLFWANWLAAEGPELWVLSSWTAPVQRLISSVLAASVITNFSASFPPRFEILLNNANPLPASMINGPVNQFSSELFWPMSWVPLALVGEWYGAGGPWAQLTLYFLIGLWSGLLLRAFWRIRFSFGYGLTLGIIVLFAALSMQYPSRLAFRGLSLLLVMPLGLMVPRVIAYLQELFRKDIIHA